MPLPIPPPDADGWTTKTSLPLYWCRYGSGPEKLLVLHGGPGAHHDYLLPQVLALAAPGRSLFFYDQRGGGRSRADNPDPVTWRTQVDDLALVIEELDLHDATLVGYSWGALLALLYCLERHKTAAPLPPALVLIDPAPLARRWRVEFEEVFRKRQADETITRLRGELADSGLRESDPTAYRQRQFELGVAAYFADPRRATDLTPFRVTGRVQQSIWESLGDFDLIPRLSGLDLPSLVFHGWHDPIPIESTFAAARAMRARFVVMEASGHVPYVEQPDVLFAAIEQFLDDIKKKSR
ncbi:MAG: alpha/beta fold hydrolase [Gemmatimonadota bacterium]